jgi:hypothetical protein
MRLALLITILPSHTSYGTEALGQSTHAPPIPYHENIGDEVALHVTKRAQMMQIKSTSLIDSSNRGSIAVALELRAADVYMEVVNLILWSMSTLLFRN